MCLLAGVRHQVASLLGGPFPGGMQGDSADADAPGGVLDHRQDVGLGAVEQVGGKEVARQDRLGLGTRELRPGRSGSAWRRVGSGLLQNLPDR
jgi:hypothetical protein